MFLFTEAIDHGTEMTALNSAVTGADKLNQNIKCMLNYAGNCLTNQHGDINYAHDILADESKCEFIVVWETAMTDSAKYADILLPDLFRFEQVSQIGTGGDNAYMISGQPCTTPKFERKTLYDALTLIADKMGVKEQFTEGKTQEEWIKELYEKTREKDTELPTYDEAMEMGVYTRKNPKGATIAFEAFRNDPAANPLDTPTGKIEIYSETLAGIAATWELGEEDLISPTRCTRTASPRPTCPPTSSPCVAAASTIAVARTPLGAALSCSRKSTRRRRGSTPPTRRSAASSRATRSA